MVMEMKNLLILFCVVLTSVVVAAPLRVAVSIHAQLESVQSVGGSQVQVSVVLPSGASPEFFAPRPAQIRDLSQSAIYFTIGVPMEHSLVPRLKSMVPSLVVKDTTQGMEWLKMEGEHHHHHGGDGAHEGLDPHVWLSVDNMKCHADAVAEALSAALPEHAADFKARALAYKNQLDALHKEVLAKTEALRGKTLLVFHPAFGYLFHECGIAQLSVEEDGKAAGGRHLAELTSLVGKLGLKVMLVPVQANKKSALATAESLGVKPLFLDPIPLNYSADLLKLAESLK